MKSKFVYAGVGVASAAYGALVAWGLTADYYERKLRDSDKVIEHYEDKIYDLENGIGSTEAEVALFNESMHLVDEDDDFGIQELRESLASDTPTAPDEVPPPVGRVIDNATLTSVNIGDPNGVGTIEVVGTPEEISEMETELAHVDDEDVPGIEGETPEETKSSLQKLIDKYTAAPEDRDQFVELAANSSLMVSNVPPEVISQDEYAYGEDGEEYAKITIHYYPRHRVLLDEDEDPIVGKEIDTKVGWANLRRFGDQSGDGNVVFVRNHRLLVDFEVVQYPADDLPPHVKLGMPKDEYKKRKAAGLIPEEL